MTQRYEYEFSERGKLTRVERALIGLAVKGIKPGCEVGVSSGAKELARKYNLEYVKSHPWDPEDPMKFSSYEIAQKRRCLDVINERGLPNIPQLTKRIQKLLSQLEGMSVAKALAKLSAYSRRDKQFPIVNEENRERPEVFVLQGVLYGYNLCCIEYACKTIYFGEPYDQTTEEIWDIPGDLNPHARCPKCTRELLMKAKRKKK